MRRTLVALILALSGCGELPRDVIVSIGADAGASILFQDFDEGWPGVHSPDGLWRIAGPWSGTHDNTMDPANASLSAAAGGLLSITVRARQTSAAEVQTVGAAGSTLDYGYYEARLKVTDVPGVCVSFLWKEVDYAAGAIEVTFLTNESWITSADTGQAHLIVSPDADALGTHVVQALPFHPSRDYHRYGWLWTSSTVAFTVDGVVAQTFTNPPATNIANNRGGYIMLNTWTGNPNWGGGPPDADATSQIDWVRLIPGATSIPGL